MCALLGALGALDALDAEVFSLTIVSSHPIQYNAPWFRALSERVDLRVLYAHRQDPKQQGRAGYGVEFDWDIDLLSGYASSFLNNRSVRPGVDYFAGCDTPDVNMHLGSPDAVIVLGWHLKTYWQAARAARARGIPVAVRSDSQLNTPRPWWLRAAKRIAYPRRLAAFDRYLPVGMRSLDYLVAYGVSRDKCEICPHTIDVERFKAKADEQGRSMRESFGLAPDVRIAAFAGRMVEWKRPEDVIDAVSRCTRSPWVCLFIGAGPERANLESLASARGVNSIFVGFRNQGEMPAVLAASDVLVIPSDGNETWGLVANEALASGSPVVVSDQAGCAADLGAYDAVQVYRCGDTAALANCLEVIASRPRQAWRDAALVTARRFTPDVAARAIERMLGNLR